jgi:hypothetical protein
MVYAGGGVAAGAAAAAAALANATKASGAIVKMEPKEFQRIVGKADEPLIVRAQGGWRTKHYRYITSYKGLFFFTKSPVELTFSSRSELIFANKIWIPD